MICKREANASRQFTTRVAHRRIPLRGGVRSSLANPYICSLVISLSLITLLSLFITLPPLALGCTFSFLIESRLLARRFPVLPFLVFFVINHRRLILQTHLIANTGSVEWLVSGVSIGTTASAFRTATASERKLFPSRYISLTSTNSSR